MTISDTVGHIWRTSVLLQSARWTGRHLARLAGPALIASLPAAIVVYLAAMPLVGDAGGLVNGQFALLSALPGPLVGWTVAMGVVSMLAHAVVLPATVLMAAGLMLDRSVSPSVALRTALRRAPAMLAAGAIMLLGWVAIVAAGLGVAWVTAQVWLAILVMLGFAALAAPFLLAVPAVILEGRSGWRALGRGWRLGDRLAYGGVTLLVGVLGVPALAWQGLDRLMPQLPDSIAAAVTGVGYGLVGVLATVFQAVVLARMFLFLPDESERERVSEEVLRLLPHGPPVPARPVRVVAALALPGLLYGGVALINPLGWVEVTEKTLAEGWTRDSESSGGGGLGPYSVDLRALYSGTDRPLTMVMNNTLSHRSGIRTSVLTCEDADCRDNTLTYPRGPNQFGPVVGSARLADGRLVLAVWTKNPGDSPGRVPMVRLGLLICDREGCRSPEGGKPLSEPDGYVFGNTDPVAIAVRPNGGLVIAQTRENEGSRDEPDSETVSFTYCDDPICSRPERRMSATLDADFGSYEDDVLALVVGADDRPVAARADSKTGAMFVIACADAACTTPRVAKPEEGSDKEDADGDFLRYMYASDKRGHLTMAMRADGRPVIVRRDVMDGSISLLDCRDRTCAQIDKVALAGPALARWLPALAVDKAGRALVAYQDPKARQIVLATCSGGKCETAVAARIRNSLGSVLTMTLDGRGRPVIAWVDDTLGRQREWALKVTTVL
ncbi:hypothetical protein ACFPOI_21600 [Nonomuraea angiospora]|uniref:Uncharacterized protein n=1 Tax=Nonomuraea angiospora TaxID=46172 RepID=A0ABR9MKI8_9ACTN|nr:hypothetical protein [Nonomuraea angiospora]MBE1593264.1 hypothetical protein [Nonomuraea angiospora]